jgi:hypothetical protein
MKMAIGMKAGLALALLGTLAPAPRAARGGESSNYRFSSPPANSMGVKGMADLRGKPVLIDFWGTH